jgi:metallo-beta-lactamase family protein
MATGGRVLHHLALHAGHHRNLILLTGYQTPGTRGARLAAGEKTLRMLGQEVSIRAQVEQLQSASAHADAEQLLAWLQQVQPAPARVFVTHGDMGASDALRQRIEHGLRWRAQVPRAGASYTV